MKNDYSKYPDHPLHGVPEEALAKAHAALEAAILDGSTQSLSMVEPVADAVVAAAVQEMGKRGFLTKPRLYLDEIHRRLARRLRFERVSRRKYQSLWSHERTDARERTARLASALGYYPPNRSADFSKLIDMVISLRGRNAELRQKIKDLTRDLPENTVPVRFLIGNDVQETGLWVPEGTSVDNEEDREELLIMMNNLLGPDEEGGKP